MNLSASIILVVLAATVDAAIGDMVRDKKAGKGCSGCSGYSDCSPDSRGTHQDVHGEHQ